jgi:Tfp pilus assembly protein PilV
MFATIRTSQRECFPPETGTARALGASTSATERAGEEGFLLIEVVISALLVALIVIATFTGFDVVTRTTAEQRHHNQAAVLAAQSQEQLRTNPASTLDTIVGEGHEHVYTETVGGTTYTITQSARNINGSTGSAGCIANKETTTGATFLEVTSSVTWPELKATANGKRPEVTQSSIITPPDGSGLEVDISNGEAATPSTPVGGAKVLASYQSAEAELPTNVEATTGSAGCVLYNGIPSDTATIEASKVNYVTPSGSYLYGPREVSIAPNITTHFPVELAEGGAIEAEFLHEGKKTYEYESGKPEEVKGDTFVAANHLMVVAPEYILGGTKIKTSNSNSTYEGETGSYAAKAMTPVNALRYAKGDLFPFEKGSWSVYAGDCLSNDAGTATKNAVSDGSISVAAGTTVKVGIPTSYVRLTVYKGTSSSNGGAETTAQKIKITNISCASSSFPDNATILTTTHEQATNKEGHLENPFQPFGKFELCLQGANKTYKASYETVTAKGPAALEIFLKETATEKSKGTNKSITVTEGSSPKC